MAYTPVPLEETGRFWTAANHNIYIRNNFAEVVPGILGAKGDLVVGFDNDDASPAMAVGPNYAMLQAMASEERGVQWITTGPGFELRNAGSQSISNDNPTSLQFDDVINDFGGILTSGGRTGRIPVGLSGVYHICVAGYFPGVTGNHKIVQIGVQIAGDAVLGMGYGNLWATQAMNNDLTAMWVTFSSMFYLPEGATVEAMALHRLGATYNLYDARFAMCMMR